MSYLIDHINRQFNRDFHLGFHSFRPFPISLSSFFDHEVKSYSRRFKVGEKDGNLTLSLELPGFKQSEVEVQLEKEFLSVKAKSGEDEIEHSITVGTDIDPDKVEAKLENGVLRLTLPRLESSKARKILLK